MYLEILASFGKSRTIFPSSKSNRISAACLLTSLATSRVFRCSISTIVGGSVMTLFDALITMDYFMKVHSSLSDLLVVRRKVKKI